MNSLINKSFYILTLVSALILLNGETAFSQQNDTSSSLITETISSVSSNLDSDYGPSYNLDNDSQVNSFLQELEISNELVYENMNQLGSVKEISNIDGDNEEVFYEDSSDNQTTELNEVKNEISNVLEELANDNVLSEEIIYEANKSIENVNSSENNFNDLKSEHNFFCFCIINPNRRD